MAGQERYCFGPYTLDAAAQVLLRDGKPVEVQPKPFDVLVLLVRGAGRMLLKDELLSEAWPSTFVDEGSLARTVSTLRKLLADDHHTFIETVPKRGYRFVAPVTRLGTGPPPSPVAVLPFAHEDDSDSELIAFAVTDSLIGALSRLEALAVRPTSAVLNYTSNGAASLMQAGRELGVDYVVGGRVDLREDRIRIDVELLDLKKGSITFSERFDDLRARIPFVHHAIGGRVVNVIAQRLPGSDRERMTRRGTDDPDAYLAYVRGRYYLNKLALGTEAITNFARAIDLDPAYALAYAGLANAYYITCGPSSAHLDLRETVPKARAAVAKALDLEPDLGEAWQTSAMLRFWQTWDRTGAESDYHRAIDLAPHCPHGRSIYGWFLTAVGRFEEAEAELRLALELDPLSPSASTSIALPRYFARHFDSAAGCLETVGSTPYFWYRDYLLGLTYAALGRHEAARAALDRTIERTAGCIAEARAALARAHALAGDRAQALALARSLAESRSPCTGAYDMAGVYAALGDNDAAFHWLETAYSEHDRWTAWLGVDPALDALRFDPRWPDLIAKCGFGQLVVS